MTSTRSPSRFDATWLHLREAADRRSRCVELTDAVRSWLRAHGGAHPVAVDLGAGAGANVRHLRGAFDGSLRWRLVDQDAGLLERARVDFRSGGRLELRVADLATDLRPIVGDARLVTASALLDLTSAVWIDRLADACRASGAAVLVVLTIDGRVHFDPADPDDALVCARVAEDEQRDKGMGPALGPRAAERLASALAARGYQVRTADSSWRLGPPDRRLAGALLDGWRRAARHGRTDTCRRVDAWAMRRQQALEDDRLRIVVGHTDVLGLPREASAP